MSSGFEDTLRVERYPLDSWGIAGPHTFVATASATPGAASTSRFRGLMCWGDSMPGENLVW
ncbi:Hypothetical protein A7982_02090 [Minicystis rosea]|nr:Hypothetical protein A7982_02090 [Minicystis rosea]